MIEVRRMRPADVPQVAALEAAVFSMPWSTQGFLDSLERKDTVFLTACQGEKVEGYVGMYVSCGEGEVVNVAVLPEARRTGIGDRLMTELHACAARENIQQIVLEVRISNEAAIRLYEKHGFTRCGIRRGFYELPREDAYIMVCSL